MPNNKRLGIFLLGIFLLTVSILFLTAGCIGNTEQKTIATREDSAERIVVFTTIFPLYDFASQVGRDKVEVINIMPPGVEPHHWEPKPADLAGMQKANVFIYCGAGLEGWVENTLQSLQQKNLVVVDASRGINLIDAAGEESHDPKDTHLEKKDPHIWLDPVNASVMVDNILQGLCQASPQNAAFFQANANQYKEKLAELDSAFRQLGQQARVKHFVTSHAAFGYLAKRYGLTQIPLRGLSADSEPTPKTMMQVAQQVKKLKIKHIFFENLISPQASQALARETGATTLVLHPLANLTREEFAARKSYLDIMQENLHNLQIALQARQ
ncbi:MAG: metal ABC transporter substrate-binding protein [Bacillota bacterium]|uniref:metal ABC transporter substrate-binding protein n=1 Tax=Desulfurispora thermophila TaxID=265470 RepID=UPI0003614F74|nr:metal ABC transporter substrate-binding protein [Desulfurispora thermophila]